MKIAMWSGPRNLSTAMMYSFGNRSDFAASDEPFFGAFLARTGIDHPMREETIATMENDPHKVATALAGPPPDRKPHWYQKHMCHHMIDGFPLDWAETCVNVHLLRHPCPRHRQLYYEARKPDARRYRLHPSDPACLRPARPDHRQRRHPSRSRGVAESPLRRDRPALLMTRCSDGPPDPVNTTAHGHLIGTTLCTNRPGSLAAKGRCLRPNIRSWRRRSSITRPSKRKR